MNLVVDSSVAAKWLFAEPDSDRAETLLQAADAETVKLISPDILTAEIGNAIWKRVNRHDLDGKSAIEAADYFEGICPLLYPSRDLWRPALRLAIAYGHPLYDCLYLALAEELPSELVTADGRFYAVFARDFPRLRVLRDWTRPIP